MVTLVVEESRGGGLRFSVIDTGMGIPEEKDAEMFTPFSRLGRENSGISGTGIGLSITRELTEAMGGVIGFESTNKLGSNFWVDFLIVSGKLSRKDSHEVLAGAAAITAAADTASQTTHTVLCVENDPSSLKLLESIIDRISGTTMISAHTGELGVDIARFKAPT